jgi:hypothetical protein
VTSSGRSDTEIADRFARALVEDGLAKPGFAMRLAFKVRAWAEREGLNEAEAAAMLIGACAMHQALTSEDAG